MAAWHIICELEAADLRIWQQNPAMLARRNALPKNNHLVAIGSTIVNMKLLKKKEGEEEKQEE